MLLKSFITDLPIDAIASCPTALENSHLIAVGCYELDKDRRNGAVLLGTVTYDLCDGLSFNLNSNIKLSCGILDVKLKQEFHKPNNFLLCFVGSNCSLHFAQLNLKSSLTSSSITWHKQWITSPLRDSPVIGLSMDIFTESCVTYMEGRSIAAVMGLSNGEVAYSPTLYLQDTTDTLFNPISDPTNVIFKAHNAEVWAVCINHKAPETQIITGADDNQMRYWDLRASVRKAVLANCLHPMGVTSLASSGTTIFSGCFDGILRVWDQRNMKIPVLKYMTASKEGIWRIQLRTLDNLQSEILLAATQGGCEICHMPSDFGAIAPFYNHQYHNSMTYGVASLCLQGQHQYQTLPLYVSGSFYDKRLAFWTPYD